MKYVLNDHSPDFVLSVGFGGALYSGAEIGDLIWASRVLFVDDGIAETIGVQEGQKTAVRILERIAIREGTILTLGKRTRKSEIRDDLYRGLLFPVCDMETFPLARIAGEKGLPFFAVRSITDRADEDIPSALYDVADESGRYRQSRALMLLLRNPGLVPSGVRLGKNSMTASRNLWHAVRCLIETF